MQFPTFDVAGTGSGNLALRSNLGQILNPDISETRSRIPIMFILKPLPNC